MGTSEVEMNSHSTKAGGNTVSGQYSSPFRGDRQDSSLCESVNLSLLEGHRQDSYSRMDISSSNHFDSNLCIKSFFNS